jgi:catechol 2,3-dioxygenase
VSALDPATRIGAVHLTVRDLAGLTAFYRDRLGFGVASMADGVARLGAGGPDLLVLRESAKAPRVPGTTGLFHFAILVPSRADLAEALARLIADRTRLSGASDHLVSEALYLPDPEGNGIEIYRDRAREEWPMAPGGGVQMDTLGLDLDDLLAARASAGEPARRLANGTRIGHVHLHVSRLAEAEAFYVEALGMDVMARYGRGASFVAAGGYHHHVGLNTWLGEGAPPPPPGAAGLDHFVLTLPDRAALDGVVERLRAARAPVESAGGEIVTRDPSSNRIVLAVDRAKQPG